MRIIALLTLVLCPYLSPAQITIGTVTLPKVGDILEYQNFNNYTDTVAHRMSGEDRTWVFEGMDIVGRQEEAYRDIEGTALADSFPEANLLLDFGGFEAAGLRTMNTVELVGISTDDFGLGIGAAVNLDENFVIARRPLAYGDSSSDNFNASVTFSTDLIPNIDSFEIPIPGASLDSLRVVTSIARTDEVIGWGTATVFNETKEVLQMRRTETTSNSFEIGLLFLGQPLWLPADELLALLGGGGGGTDPGIPALGGEQMTTSYLFFTDDLKTSVIEFSENTTLDSLGAVIDIQITGRISGDITSANKELSFDDGGYRVYPNPANNYLDIECNLTIRDVNIYNMNGVLQFNLGTLGIGTHSLDIGNINSGVYIIKYINEESEVETRKFVKL